MSRRRLERGFWNGRQVEVTKKEHGRVYALNENRGYFFRFPVMIRMDWPFPDEFRTIHRLPRKTKKALWKQFNGHPDADLKGVLVYNGFSWGIHMPDSALIHNGRKP